MKVLVIGGAGYIGSHVVKELMAKGHKVTVFDNLSSGLEQNLFKENGFIKGDILNPEDLDKAFAKGFDAFIHLAAFKAAGESMEKPEKYSVNNITGTLNIMNAAVKYNCLKMIFSSSAATFGEPQYLPMDEKHPQNPSNYYGFTKLEIERFMDWYDQLKGMKFAALRYFNAAGAIEDGSIGEDHNPETHLIPLILQVPLGKREHITIFGDDYPTPDGTCLRDYIHVLDLADAHVLAVDYLRKGGESNIFNLGNGQGFSVKEMIEAAEEATGRHIKVEIGARRAGDPAQLIASSEKARSVLGWKPRFTDVRAVIGTAWKWHQQHPEGYSK